MAERKRENIKKEEEEKKKEEEEQEEEDVEETRPVRNRKKTKTIEATYLLPYLNLNKAQE